MVAQVLVEQPNLKPCLSGGGGGGARNNSTGTDSSGGTGGGMVTIRPNLQHQPRSRLTGKMEIARTTMVVGGGGAGVAV